VANFLTSEEFIKRYDSRRIRELLSDTGAPVAEGDLATNENLLAILGEATEMILSACQVGEEYSELELQTLADSETSGFLIRRLCADLGYSLLVARRCTSSDQLNKQAPQWQFANVQLQQIRDGYLLFPRIGDGAHEDAGNPRTANLQTQVTTPDPNCSWSSQVNRALIPSSPLTNPFGCC